MMFELGSERRVKGNGRRQEGRACRPQATACTKMCVVHLRKWLAAVARVVRASQLMWEEGPCRSSLPPNIP
jgi:hypothetical protein